MRMSRCILEMISGKCTLSECSPYYTIADYNLKIKHIKNCKNLRGSTFSGENQIVVFLHILKEHFKTFKLVFAWTPYLHFSLRYGGPNLGPKNTQNLKFIRNEKFWCQIVGNSLFPKPFEFLTSDENWPSYDPTKGPKRPPKPRFHSLWGFFNRMTWSYLNLNLFMSLFDYEYT